MSTLEVVARQQPKALEGFWKNLGTATLIRMTELFIINLVCPDAVRAPFLKQYRPLGRLGEDQKELENFG